MLKKYILIWLTIISSVIFIIRLASLQLSNDSYFNSDFAIQELSVYPERGLIFDRNGNLLVANQPSYELIIIPENTPEFDTISFSNLINIDPNNLKKEIIQQNFLQLLNHKYQKRKMLFFKRKYGNIKDSI